ncbi:MAG: hypothetical protein Q8M07_27380 [Prosthecobacter sp.]|nr:hypothetical protein [Prosthecobacter sp.]
MKPHPFAKIFAPVVFGALALLTVGMSFGPGQVDQAEIVAEAPRVERTVPAK